MKALYPLSFPFTVAAQRWILTKLSRTLLFTCALSSYPIVWNGRMRGWGNFARWIAKIAFLMKVLGTRFDFTAGRDDT